ncbi:carbon starvation protein A [Candidatus Marinamargulisbacteria bacterium SCGC AAA071-K20]|nr:carbon starvation protein A [Candidatus Marinamargulisbacteria bacterium SCGC AAA071-K20]
MNALLLFILTSLAYLVAYHTYGKFLAKKIFKINPNAAVPSKVYEDGKDYVPSERHVMFGHHFTSIAGTGPIVGPAIGVIWGWLPAVIWIVGGSIFMGAVHDFGSLIVSMRHKGRSISEIAGVVINKRVRTMFYIVVFLALLVVIAIFGLVIAVIFAQFPSSVLAVWAEIPVAILFGWMAFKKNKSLVWSTIVAVIAMYVFVFLGDIIPITLQGTTWLPATGLWTLILLTYAYFASILPVGFLLQPRDYLNAWQLYVGLGVVVLGLVATHFVTDFQIVAPALQLHPEGAPPILPFLFITIACGAVSGFHCLVCSGTSSKQISTESDAQFVGYGSMMVEAGLATVVIIAVTAGIGLSYDSGGNTLTGVQAWNAHYGSWASSAGLGSKLTAVVVGCANMMKTIGVPMSMGIAIMGVFIASFAGTTLDSATRVQRYIIAELFTDLKMPFFANKWVATGIAVVTAALMAFSSGANGKGALALWPMFGAINQLLGCLALLVITAYLRGKGGLKYIVTAIPCVILLVMTMWASTLNQLKFIAEGNYILSSINGIVIILAIAMIIEGGIVFVKGPNKNKLKSDDLTMESSCC